MDSVLDVKKSEDIKTVVEGEKEKSQEGVLTKSKAKELLKTYAAIVRMAKKLSPEETSLDTDNLQKYLTTFDLKMNF